MSAPTPINADREFVFIGGLHRSGTSLLHRTLGTHPDVSRFTDTGVPEDEGQHLQKVMGTAGRHGGIARFAMDPEAHLTEESALATKPGTADRLLKAWGKHWDPDRRLLVEKSPPNVIRARFLQAIFPNSRFVMIVRHPIANSLAAKKMAKRTKLHERIDHWFAAHQIMRNDLPYLNSVLVLRYEDFCADPDGVLRELAEFLGVPDEFERPEIDPDVEAKYRDKWHDVTRRPLVGSYAKIAALRHHRDAASYGYGIREPWVRGPMELPEYASRAHAPQG